MRAERVGREMPKGETAKLKALERAKGSILPGPAAQSRTGIFLGKGTDLVASKSNWRSQLLGSLEGQLQLATYTAVLIGFTGATTTGLWLSNRNQIRNGEVELKANAEHLISALMDYDHLGQGHSAKDWSPSTHAEVRQELRDHSGVRTTHPMDRIGGWTPRAAEIRSHPHPHNHDASHHEGSQKRSHNPTDQCGRPELPHASGSCLSNRRKGLE
ncbi:hypothetical protein [Synechococcus sp. Cu2B8-bc1011]|uniref:hypothetical protein n=1 Tax=Synechococcus sp. Cu2B8-bc1011 TaxID=3093725 RepID=UPI0039AF1417